MPPLYSTSEGPVGGNLLWSIPKLPPAVSWRLAKRLRLVGTHICRQANQSEWPGSTDTVSEEHLLGGIYWGASLSCVWLSSCSSHSGVHRGPDPCMLEFTSRVTIHPNLPRIAPLDATTIMNTHPPTSTYKLHDWGAPAHTGTWIKVRWGIEQHMKDGVGHHLENQDRGYSNDYVEKAFKFIVWQN